MQGSTRPSKRARLRAVFPRVGRPVVPDTPQWPPDSRTRNLPSLSPVETHGSGPNIIKEAHSSSSPSPVEPHGNSTTSIGIWHSHAAYIPIMNPLSTRSEETEIDKLSNHAIYGVTYDSGDRAPPPRCVPGTRVQLREKIILWSRNNMREKALFWLNGPAGVGKSTVVQTVAESLAESGHLGATVFFSRPNDRIDPQRVFTTIAYGLLVSIQSSYRRFIEEKIVRDPALLQKGMEEQFQNFITEPFGLKKLVGEGNALGIILDGLDECGRNDDQRKIIRLIGEFVFRFPHAPLFWIIASRAEPHIASTFAEETIAESHWSEYIPIGSAEACQDVEHCLSAGIREVKAEYPDHFSEPIRRESRRLLELIDYASGFLLPVSVAIRYIEDLDYANPLGRFDLLHSFLNHSPRCGDNPFATLDAMYTSILMTVPSTSWAVTRRILGFVLCVRGARSFDPSFQLQSHTLAAISTILDLKDSTIYHSLHQLHSVLEIPPQKFTHDSGILFLHDSFAEYLMDQDRSQEYFVDIGECIDDIVCCLYRIFLRKPWDREPSQSPPVQLGAKNDIHQDLKFDAEAALYYTVTGDHKTAQQRGPFVSQQVRSECLDALSQTNTTKLGFNPIWAPRFSKWLFALWKDFSEELEKKKLVEEAQLKDLKFDHLDWSKNKPAYVNNYNYLWSPDSASTLEKFIAELQLLQKDSPKTKVLVCGSTPERRSIFFSCEYQEQVNNKCLSLERYYCIPYPY